MKKRSWIKFMKSGEKATKTRIPLESYLTASRDWKLQVDLPGTTLKIPEHICQTTKRPDMILVSEATKQMMIMELTVPGEDGVEAAAHRKKTNYAPIVERSNRNGYRTSLWTVEVGCKGFAASSLSRFLKDMGYIGKRKSLICKKVEEIAEDASHKLWSWSHMKVWGKQ